MVNPNEDTEFNDALRAHGILPPKPPSRSPSPDIPHITHSDAINAIASTATADQLDLLLEGDGIDSDDERVFEDYKKRRLEEMKKEEKRGKYGSLEPLSREDFVKEVTEGSKVSPDGVQEDEDEDDDEDDDEENGRKKGLRGTGVVVFLYKDSVPLSQHLRPLLQRLAAAHPASKFLSIPAGMCIPNYPDKNVPTLLIYRNGEMLGNVVAGAGLNGMKTTVKELEMLLLRYRALEKPSPSLNTRARDDSDDDDDLQGEIGMVNTKSQGIRSGGGIGTGTRSGGGGRPAVDSDDSDFDM